MPRIAIIGGTRYVGKRVVRRLLEDGLDVTVVTRGRVSDTFGDALTRRTADASSPEQLSNALADGPPYDAVLHQVAYHPLHADALLQAARGRVERVVVTSTIEVYNPASLLQAPPSVADGVHSPFREDDLVLVDYPVQRDVPWDSLDYLEAHYGEGKRQVEAMTLGQHEIPTATARLAHVLAADDPTGRLSALVETVRNGRDVAVHARSGHSSFVHADDAANALIALLLSTKTGAFNVTPATGMDVGELTETIAEASGSQPPSLTAVGSLRSEELAPFTYEDDFVMDNARISELGVVLRDPSRWLPEVVRDLITQEG